ncbi:MAG: 2-dehydro-3-deoxyphosphogluconate aldolase [Promethearchaeota archaeon CR_4]|nr:MAG: 2-dehydro-3-deoxyphosphogluconate aldolase [Candidatus Lokiarchaeota archaeon CR_4]
MKEPLDKGVFVETLTGYDQKLVPSDKAQHMLHIFLARAGVRGIILNGETGEFPSLSLAERKHLQDIALFDGTSLKVISHIGTSNLGDTLELATHVIKLAQTAPKGKFAGVAIIPPYFYPTRELGLKNYFEILLRKIDEPVILVNNPPFTMGNKITPSLLESLKEFSQIMAIQDESGDIEFFKEMRQKIPEMPIYIAYESFFLNGLRGGASGIISAIGNIFPELLVEMFTLSQKRAWDDIVTIQEQVIDIVTAVNRQPLHAALKVGVTQRLPDFGPPNVRPPLANMNFQEIQLYLSEIAPIMKKYREEKPPEKKLLDQKLVI